MTIVKHQLYEEIVQLSLNAPIRKFRTTGENMYELEQLTKTFAGHGAKAESDRLKMIEHHKANFPDTPVSEWLTEEFNVATALHHICIEIEKLWIAIGGR